ncbi:MAG: hypothetical protein SPF17_05480 [Candidatus Mucispirillum faecigallinarum]|nr:hypothetical protein [Candidatus Mucispirillum faecigallinarum]
MLQEIWTILDEQSLPVLSFTSFISLDSDNTSKITNYTSEKGTFSSYNKIVAPDELAVTLAIQGNAAEIQDAIAVLDTLRKEPQKVSIVSPYKEYKWFSLESYSYSFNQSQGVNLLIAAMNFKQVNEVEAVYTNSIKYTKNPSASSAVNGGKKQGLQSILSKITERF